jgi:hypothetical protein
MHGFSKDVLRMRLFPFSLMEKSKHWLKSLEVNIVISWAQMQQEFLEKYFPIGKTNQIRKPFLLNLRSVSEMQKIGFYLKIKECY